MLLVGILLLAGMALIAVQSVGYRRGAFNSEFWRLPLDDKLDRVAVRKWEWWWVAIWDLVGLFLMTGGLAGLTHLLAESGEGVLAYVALGGYLVALFSWFFGVIIQAAGVSHAADQRKKAGATPSWIHPFWTAGYLAEAVWVIGTSLAYVVLGVAILQSGLIAPWSGWAAVGLGIVIPVAVLLARTGFPQLGYFVPFVVGIALIIEAM